MPIVTEHSGCLGGLSLIMQTIQIVVDLRDSLQGFLAERMNGISRLLRAIPQLPDAKMPQIVPQNANAEPFPVPGRLCMVGERKRFCFRVNSKVGFQFLRGGCS